MTNPTPKASPYPALSRLDRLLLLAIAVVLFVVLDGPVWGHLFNWDRAIGWSYAAVPLLVLLALAARHRFSWVAWLLHSLELILWKFGITAGILLSVLVLANPGGPAPAKPEVAPPAPTAAALPPPPSAGGRLEGRVSRLGAAAPEALVFISSGVDDFAWPAPTTTLHLTNDGHGFEPTLAAAQVGESITASSADHHLHTLLMTQAGKAWRLNVPLLASGEPTPIRPGQVQGMVELACAVHGATEHVSRLVLLRHPFFQSLHPDGSFAFDGVPPGSVTLTAIGPDGSHTNTVATVRAHETSHAQWSLPGAAGK